jgi:2-C-methyl-D-erythritol 4-phosphate cytidylyltransferase / 2-C-methyl-D-erythritol 2,4-cyclodiphosphate synthase
MEAFAILVAAGRGERMQAALPKAFLPLAGRSLLRWAAEAFEASRVDGIVAVVPDALRGEARDLLVGISKLRAVVAGGLRRQDSVTAGLVALPAGFEGVVLVHDAARPLVSPEIIEAVSAAAGETGAALPVLPLVDTVKRVRDGRVESTLDRSELFAAQTPQGFRLGVLARAYAEAEAAGLSLTDEAMAVERLGLPVRAVPGHPRNRKLTTPEDLRWAEQLLRSEEAARLHESAAPVSRG